MTRMILPLLAGLCGALLMALEILASRILAPYFGNSVYVWGSIISVFLASMSLGYFWGGRLADRHPSLAALGRLLLLSALWLLALRLWSAEVTRAVADLTAASPGGTLLACTLLFGVPGVLFGMVSPFVIRLAADDLARLGKTSGRIYAVSTVGSLAGTLLCTFVAIPRFPVTQILAALALGAGATAALSLADKMRRPWEPALAILVALAVFAVRDDGGARSEEVVAVRGTAYQTLEIFDRAGARYLRSDRVTQSAIWLDSGEIASRYIHYVGAALLATPRPRRVLAIGMGGGLVSRVLHRAAPGLVVDYVELDPAVPEMAEQFGFWRPDDGDRVHIGDGRQFLNRSSLTWDLIYVDAYIGLAVPFHLTTREFFAVARDHLTPQGSVALNLAAGLEDPFSRSLLHTLRESFRTTLVFKVRGAGNVLLVANDSPQPSRAELEVRAATAAAEDLPMPLTEIVRDLTDWQYETADLIELRDDFAPAEHLVTLGDQDFDLALLASAGEVDER